MLHGYATREELIRDHWKRYGLHWNVRESPRWKMAIRHKRYPFMALEKREDLPTDLDIALEFSFERGLLDGRPAGRVTCEGVVVEEAPL